MMRESSSMHLQTSPSTSGMQVHMIAPMKTDSVYSLSLEKISQIWGIGIPVAKRTREATTQKGVRTVAYPSVERRWPTGDRPLHYRRLNHQLYQDTLKSRIISLVGNTCSEIYTTDFVFKNIPDEKGI
jgi:hypothetical protein